MWAGYTRVSRVGDREDTLISPQVQEERIRSYARDRGFEVETLPAELDVSGGKLKRPILEQAIQGVEYGRYEGVIVADIDRLSRLNLVDALKIIERIEGAGGQVIAVAQNFDASTPEGEWARNVWLSTANMMLKRYSSQFRVAKQRAVDQGIWPTNTPPIGYRRGADRRLELDPARAPVVVEAFEARAASRSWREVGQILDRGGSGAAKVIANRVYLGEVRVGEWVNPSAHEALVDRGLWEAAQQSHPRPARSGGSRALLVGLVRCAGCGCAMTPNVRGAERIYRCVAANKAGWRCPSPAIISQPKLDPYVEHAVLDEIGRLEVHARERTTDLSIAERTLGEAEAELREYHQAVQVTDVGADAFKAGNQARQEAVEQAQSRVAAAWAVASPPAGQADGSIGDLWGDLSVEERGQVLRGALDVVWVRKGSGPAVDRVRLVANGYGPRRVRGRRVELNPLDWVADLPGEIRPAAASNAA